MDLLADVGALSGHEQTLDELGHRLRRQNRRRVRKLHPHRTGRDAFSGRSPSPAPVLFRFSAKIQTNRSAAQKATEKVGILAGKVGDPREQHGRRHDAHLRRLCALYRRQNIAKYGF